MFMSGLQKKHFCSTKPSCQHLNVFVEKKLFGQRSGLNIASADRENEKDNKVAEIRKQSGGATIAQWICLCLPSCRPGFESGAQHLRFYQLPIVNLCYICHVKQNENKQKEAGYGPFLKKKLDRSTS